MATTINRLRVRGAQTATPAYRLALESRLGQVDFRPPGMPPAAILIVRRLADPLPGRLRPAIGAPPDRQWQNAARQAMGRLYSQAARPADGPAPEGVEAVCFADEAELLACLALDASLDRAGERWWWQAYRRRWGSLARSSVPALLLGSPRTAPAALRLLAARGQAIPVVQCLSPSQARQALQAICAAFDFVAPDLSSMGTTSHLASDQAQHPPVVDGAAPPWEDWLAGAVGAGEELAPEGQCLLGVALALTHAPAYARSAGFRLAIQRWWQTVQSASRSAHDSSLARSSLAVEEPAAAQPAGGPEAQVLAPSTDEAVVTQARLNPAPEFGAAGASPSVSFRVSGQASAAHTHGLPGAAESSVAGRLSSLAEPQAGSAGAEHRAAGVGIGAASSPGDEPAFDLLGSTQGVATRLGGVLFLINLMRRLDLPACFEAEWQLGSQIGAWGTLELLARGLLAGRDDVMDDPLWTVLAVLSGRNPGELPGADFVGPDQVSLPAGWLRWLETDEAIVRPGRNSATVAALDGPLLAGASADLRRWLAVVLPCLRQMLASVLGGACNDVTALLLRRGYIYITLSHVDLVLPLDSVSIPVRMAGLDFDPGWLPAFGRVVQFHYR